MKISELLTDASKWTRGAMAKRMNVVPPEHLEPTSAMDPGASCWCLMGAAFRCSVRYEGLLARLADSIQVHFPERVRNVGLPAEIVTHFNDNPATTFSDVRTVIKTAEAMENLLRFRMSVE